MQRFPGTVTVPRGVEVATIPDEKDIVIDTRYAATSNHPGGTLEELLAREPAQHVAGRQGVLS